ncbi:hypothetical protein C8R44DRAFT_393443 [Mycena epipterygia]|nr:hypothetical protein C8R44DRAFT_393443 [Mycena epipterygia]
MFECDQDALNSAALTDGHDDLEFEAIAQPPDLVYRLKTVLSACNLTPNAKDIAIVREGSDSGRQAVFIIAHTWVVRIFELHDGYRESAAFISSVLTALENLDAPCEHIRYHGIVPDTSFHYTVTKFAEGGPLTNELCRDPGVRVQVTTLYRALRDLDVPDTVGTVEDYMQPRLARLLSKLAVINPAISQKVGPLSPLSEFRAFQMVVSHCDMAPENIIARFGPSVSVTVIDWEFCMHVPEFRVEVQLGSKVGREIWGAGFVRDCGYGPYPPQVVWTESLCMIAEDYEGQQFEETILAALSLRSL